MSDKTATPRATELLMLWEKEQKKSKSTKRKTAPADVEKTTQSKPAEKRARAFALVTYIDTQYLDKFLKRAPWVRNWAYCTHDRDVNSDNTPKEKHTHLILYTYEAKTSSAVKKLFDRYSQEVYANSGTEPQNTTSQVCHDVVSQYRYLLHQDDKEKYQYEPACRITDSLSYWRELEEKANMTGMDNNTALAMFDDFKNGVGMRDLVARWGRDAVYHQKHFREAVARDNMEQARNEDNVEAIIFLMLQNCCYPESEIKTFWKIFEWLQGEADCDYKCKLQFYLKDK